MASLTIYPMPSHLIAIFNDLMGKRSWKGGKMAYGVSEFHELIN